MNKQNKYALFLSIIFVILICGIISILVGPSKEIKYEYLDVDARNSTGLPMDVYYKQNILFNVMGWQGRLTYNEKEDRISGKESPQKIITDKFGNNYLLSSSENKISLQQTNQTEIKTSIGWFFNNIFRISSDKSWSKKKVNAKLINENSEISSAEFKYNLFKKKPHFKLQFSAQTKDNSKLGSMAYGLNLKEYDIFLPNGTFLKNDNEIIELDEKRDILLNNEKIESQDILEAVSEVEDINKLKIQRKGSASKFKDINYEIFHNPNTNLSIIIYGKEIEQYKNSFYWNVYWIYVNGNDGIYKPIYFIILEDSELNYENEAWQVKSKYYEGELTEYIYSSVDYMDEHE